MPEVLQAVLFDMDGTLADTIPDILAVFNPLLAAHGGPALTAESLVTHFGPTEEEILRKLLPLTPPEKIEQALTAALAGAGPIGLVRGVADAVAACRARGYRVGVFTGAGRRFGYSRLSRLGLGDLVEAFVAGDDVPTRKPAPEGLLLLCERLGVAPAATAYVGDSPLDVKCAQAAGAKSIGVSWGVNPREVMAASQPHHLVDTIEQLRDVLAVPRS